MAGPHQQDYIALEFPPAARENDRPRHQDSVFYRETDIETNTAINPTDTDGMNVPKKAAKWRPYVIILIILIIIIIVVVVITVTQKKTTASHKNPNHKTVSHLS
ncbi:hypothetical protein BDV12DRAFT_203382 [Aspergillus spectabilis]